MGALDLTILAPALPHIGDSYGVTPAAVVLAFSIYAAFYAVSVPLMSKLADVRGYRQVYSISLVLFTLGSAGAALAPSLPLLVAARVLQGIGGGGLFPVAQAIVGRVLPEKERGQMLGVLMAVFAAGGVLGPNLGGFLVQTFSWHWIFWINVPLGIYSLFLIWMGAPLPEDRRDARIDWVGAALVAVAFGSLVLAIEGLRDLGEVGFFTLRIGGLFALAALGFAILIPFENRRTDPILDFHFLSSATIGPLLLVSLLIGFASLCGIVFTPFYVQLQFRASAFGSGAVLNAAALGLGLSSWIAATYTHRTGGKALVIAGMGSTVMGLALMLLVHGSIWGILVGLVFLGAGLGLAQGPLSYLSLSLAPKEDHGQVSGLIAITRSMGSATGITLAGVFLGRAVHAMSRYVDAEQLSDLESQAWGSSSSLQALGQASAATQALVRQTLGQGILRGWYWAAGAAVLGLIIAFYIRRHQPATWNEGRARRIEADGRRPASGRTEALSGSPASDA